MKILFVYPRFERHAESNPELLDVVPMNEYLGSPSLGMACLAAVTPAEWAIELRDDRLSPADTPTDADIVALSFFTPAATRALELADRFRAMGKTVVAGGIFPTVMPDVVAPHVDAVVIGEGDTVWPVLLADWQRGELRKTYAPTGAVQLCDLPLPKMSLYLDAESDRFRPDDYPVQISRGCAMTCSACVLPASMTPKLRSFDHEHVIGQLAQLERAGKRACLTEDTSWFPGLAGRRRLEAVFDHLAEQPTAGTISYIGISMPMLLATPERILHTARRAGVGMFYLVGGFDPITTRAFNGRDAKALSRAVDAIRKAQDVGIDPYTSFLIGGDADDEGTVDRMLEFAAQVNLRKAEFAIATPYPGTPSWRRLLKEDRILTRDWSKYNDANVVFRPAKMTPEQLHRSYLRLWRDFYRDRTDLATMSVAERTIQF